MTEAACPAQIQIGHLSYSVIMDTDQCHYNGAEGRSNGNRQEIVLRDDRPADSTVETLLHEVLHQCLHAAGLETATLAGDDGDAIEERVVRAMSPLLLQTLRANPDLVEYLHHDTK